MPALVGTRTITTDLLSLHTAAADATRHLAARLRHLENLAPTEIDAVCRQVRRMSTMPAYEEMQKEAQREVSVLLSGLACHFNLMSNGRRQIAGFIVPGDICDYSFLTGDGAKGHIMTLTTSQIGRIAISNLTELCDQHPRIMRAVLRGSSIELALVQERVVSLGLRTALERVGHLLCEMYVRMDAVGLVSDSNSYHFPVTQAELGEALGLSTVHVNRTLQVMRKSGVITMRNGTVTIEDLDRLRAECGFDPAYLGTSRLH